MKVSQLIEALQAMPPDADIITHANNHHCGWDDTIRVGLVRCGSREPVVCIGNWSDFHLPKEGYCYSYEVAGRVFRVHGDHSARMCNWSTELTEERAEVTPPRTIERVRYDRRGAETKLTEVKP